MSYTIPTLEGLVRQGQQRHRAELPGTDAFLWPNTEHVFLKAVAGLVHLNFQYLEWIKRQRFATEADGDELDNHGKPYGMTRNAATAAHGEVILTGTVGATLPSGTKVSRSDGSLFSLRDTVTIRADGTATAYIIADVPGAEGNTTTFAELAMTEATGNITNAEVGPGGIGGGSDVEDDESFRARLLFRLRNPPRGGAAHDYVAWALAISGVTRVWVDPMAYGPGTVGVWFMTDGATESGIPNAVAVGDVRAYIEAHRPVTARPIINAPLPAPLDVCIAGLGTPSEAVREMIETEIKDVFRRRVEVSLPSAPYTCSTNLFWQAVARVTGSSTHRITKPSADVKLLPGYVPVLGSICYI
ncbi:baseplate J/gp47 family protein [uncultured Hyphomicrobium sp.]|uniref:baseplate J/gp47 family protein n=1 Tax=uncultured Hyphomicrobium sp. TaxID=194373 RepID=UPI0025F1C91C|nr:baseplate J/gp47 family protein [uncultured Hyphomicrobium sp.]